MIASTCLAVLFVPSLFVIVQRFEEWRASRSGKAAPATAAATGGVIACKHKKGRGRNHQPRPNSASRFDAYA